MFDIRRETLFQKLSPVAYQTIESSTLFCKMRGNPYLELVHWVHQLIEHPDSDVRRIVAGFELDPARLAAELTESLNRLPRGASAVQDLSPQVDRAVERAFLYASLLFQSRRIRSGHLFFALLKDKELSQALRGMSKQFDRIRSDALAERFEGLLATAPESIGQADNLEDAIRQDDGVAPAALGKQEALARYAVDLTARAKKGELDPIVGREAEIRQIIDILMRRRQNNPILIGEAGVGKTAVVEGLALRIASGDVPPPLADVQLHVLDLGLLQAGASMKGEFEQRLRQVVEEVHASPTPIILFIDEAHTLIGAGGSAGTGDAANLLKPALARGTLRTIAATTWSEYKKHIEKDPALTRRFQMVEIDEPNEELAVRMMRGTVNTLERHHKVQIMDDALASAVTLSHRYIPARQLPDKAVSLLDTACARVAVSQHAVPAALEDCRRNLDALSTELEIVEREAALGVDVTARRARVDDRTRSERDRLATLERRWRLEKGLVERLLELRASLRKSVDEPDGDHGDIAQVRAEYAKLQTELEGLQGEDGLILPTVDTQAISAIVSEWTGIPVGRMVRNEIQAVLGLADTLNKRVIGQRHALELIARRVQTTRAGLEDPRKPLGVFLLAGPSGVGKTETALALAEALFGSEQSLITINMSEFQEAHTVSTLKGAPPGYVGYGEGGVLTEAVRRRPYSVVLLDEVEKAHPDVHELFFQVFDKGRMEDGEGRQVDFKNTLILLTSNAGSDHIMKLCNDPELMPSAEALGKTLREPLLQVFPPALLGRMVTVPYYPLSEAMIRAIVDLQLSRIVKRVAARHGIPLELDDSLRALIVARCTEIESGARMIESLLSNALLPPLSQEFLTRLMHGTPLKRARVYAESGEFKFEFA